MAAKRKCFRTAGKIQSSCEKEEASPKAGFSPQSRGFSRVSASSKSSDIFFVVKWKTPGETRTRDLVFSRYTLFQLSYGGTLILADASVR